MGKVYKRYKNFLEKYLDSSHGKRFFNVVYSVGAAIVILGAMFKILHLPFGNQMLMIGMITEAIVFLLSAFERPDKEYKWEEVYPVLADDENFVPKAEREVQIQNTDIRPSVQQTSFPSSGGSNSTNINNTEGSSSSNNQTFSSTNQGGNATPISGGGSSTTVINRGGSGSSGNSQNFPLDNQGGNGVPTTGGGTIISGGTVVLDSSNVADASEKYADQLTQMSDNMSKFAEVTNSLGTISDSLLKAFQTIIDNSEGIGNNTQGYVNQMEALNRNVSGLNTIYEIQLKGVSGQIGTIEEINAGLDRMKKLYSGSLADSSIFKNETEKMAQQLVELNTVYSRLLQAMTTNMNLGGGFNPSNNSNPQP